MSLRVAIGSMVVFIVVAVAVEVEGGGAIGRVLDLGGYFPSIGTMDYFALQ
jgi:hypothetical protein